MTLTIEHDELLGALRRVKLVGLHGVAPVLLWTDGLGHACLAADSLEARVDATVPVLDGTLDGPVLLPYESVAKMVAKYPKNTPIRMTPIHRGENGSRELRLKAARSESIFCTLDPELMPDRPPLRKNAQTLELGGAWAAVKRVLPAADSHAVGWVRDVYLHGGYAYATDKYRIHRARIPKDPGETLRLPGRLANAVVAAKVDVTSLAWDSSQFELRSQDASWVASLGNPADVVKIAPHLAGHFERVSAVSFTVDKAELLRALGVVASLGVAEEGTYRESALFVFSAGCMEIMRRGQVGSHSETVDCEHTGDLTSVGFTVDRLEDTVRLMDAETVTIHGSENQLAAWWMDDGELAAAIMPTVLT